MKHFQCFLNSIAHMFKRTEGGAKSISRMVSGPHAGINREKNLFWSVRLIEDVKKPLNFWSVRGTAKHTRDAILKFHSVCFHCKALYFSLFLFPWWLLLRGSSTRTKWINLNAGRMLFIFQFRSYLYWLARYHSFR
jgi:hypothetical protein